MTDADRLAREQQRAGVRFVIGPMPIIGRTNFLLDWIAFERGIAAEYQAELAASRQSRAALEQALKALHDSVVRHGAVQGDGPEWLAAFTGLMDAVKAARALLPGAGEPR